MASMSSFAELMYEPHAYPCQSSISASASSTNTARSHPSRSSTLPLITVSTSGFVQSNTMPRQVHRPQVHGARALTLHIRFFVVALELERLEVSLDPSVRVGDVGLGQLRQHALVVGNDSENPFELNDRRGNRISGKIVVPIRFERGRRAREQPYRGVGSELRHVAAAQHHDAKHAQRRS